MKDRIKDLVNKADSYDANVNRVREYLQEYFLYILYKNKFYNQMVFCGGTALRFIHKIRRFSEDLDFSLSQKVKSLNFSAIVKSLEEEFCAAGYVLTAKHNTDTNVYKVLLKFDGLLFEYGVSSHKDEKLSIKLEIDVNPPVGGKEDATLCNNNFMLYTLHYDLASLFAGKTHALLTRQYTKGRDWYDFLWYRTKHKELEPNFEMLNNALAQSGTIKERLNSQNWRGYLRTVIDKLDIAKVKDDVFRFLESPQEADMLTRENFCAVLDI